jgi:fluoroquinolone transport system permease protein
MRRLAATLRTDLRTQYRYGFFAAAALVMIVSIVLLRWLPEEVALLLLPAVVLENVLINTFYFSAGQILLERVEGTYAAQSVTPLRIDEYLGSKLIALTALSLVEGLTIAVAVFGVHAWLMTMAAGIVLAAVFFCLVGVALVLRYDSINEFLLPSAFYTFLLSLPLLGLFGIGAPALYLAHPMQGSLELLRIDTAPSAVALLYALLYPLAWIAAAYLWSRRALARARSA